MRLPTRWSALALVLAFTAPASLSAQRVAGAIDLPLGLASRGVASGLTVAPRLALGGGPFALAASAMVMRDGTRLWMPSGNASLSMTLAAGPRLALQAVGDVRRDGVELATISRSASVGADARFVTRWVTVEGGGRAVRQWAPGGRVPGTESSLTLWTGAGRFELGASLRHRSGEHREVSDQLDSAAVDVRRCQYLRVTVDGVNRLRFDCPRPSAALDVGLGLRSTFGVLSLGAWAGRRAQGRGLTSNERPEWGTLQLGWAATRATSVIAELSRLPSDVARAIPAHTRAFVGIRLTPFSHGGDEPAATREPAPPPGAALEVSPARDGVRTIWLSAPNARSVELTGDMTGWHVAPMTLDVATGRWKLDLPLDPGTYTCNVRIDGGAWVVPAGLPAVDDALGGKAGVLVVE